MRGVGRNATSIVSRIVWVLNPIRLISSNTPHPSWRFAPTHLLPQGEKGETRTSPLPRPLSRLAIVEKSGRRAGRKAPHEFVRQEQALPCPPVRCLSPRSTGHAP